MSQEEEWGLSDIYIPATSTAEIHDTILGKWNKRVIYAVTSPRMAARAARPIPAEVFMADAPDFLVVEVALALVWVELAVLVPLSVGVAEAGG
jgi:hypothetical protein